MSIRDCYGIARSICETGINIGYIVAGGAPTARRANQHALQKTYRDLDRRGEIGGIGFVISRTSPPPDKDSIPGLREALETFTMKSGRERTAWTDDTLDDRIKLIEQRYEKVSLNFAASTISIYRHASEILHGTYFGAVYFWSPNLTPLRTRAEFDEAYVTQHFLSIFTAAFFSCQGVVRVVAQEFSAPQLASLADELLQALKELLESNLQEDQTNTS